jgi:hypothetical protein
MKPTELNDWFDGYGASSVVIEFGCGISVGMSPRTGGAALHVDMPSTGSPRFIRQAADSLYLAEKFRDAITGTD